MFTRQILIHKTVVAAMLSIAVASLPVHAGLLGGAVGGGGAGGALGGAAGSVMGGAMGGGFGPSNFNGSGMAGGQGAFTGRSAGTELPSIAKGVAKARDATPDAQTMGQGAAGGQGALTGAGQAATATPSMAPPTAPSSPSSLNALNGKATNSLTLANAAEAPSANQSAAQPNGQPSKSSSAKLRDTDLATAGNADAQAQRDSATVNGSASAQGSYKRP